MFERNYQVSNMSSRWFDDLAKEAVEWISKPVHDPRDIHPFWNITNCDVSFWEIHDKPWRSTLQCLAPLNAYVITDNSQSDLPDWHIGELRRRTYIKGVTTERYARAIVAAFGSSNKFIAFAAPVGQPSMFICNNHELAANLTEVSAGKHKYILLTVWDEDDVATRCWLDDAIPPFFVEEDSGSDRDVGLWNRHMWVLWIVSAQWNRRGAFREAYETATRACLGVD
jgi:hypothetical protein